MRQAEVADQFQRCLIATLDIQRHRWTARSANREGHCDHSGASNLKDRWTFSWLVYVYTKFVRWDRLASWSFRLIDRSTDYPGGRALFKRRE